MLILAIESSCDETSVAILENGKKVLSNVIASQIDIHKEYGGVVPEIASRHHIQNILTVYDKALKEANCKISDISYIAVTNTPGLIGSLLVGLMFAKGLSLSNNIPLIPVNHIDGHIFSTFIDNEPKLPMLTLVASGGHTSLYLINENKELNLLGETLDDAIGEAYDKVARILGFEYPGGPLLEKLAFMGNNSIEIPTPQVSGYDFSFSGIKTFITNYINKKKMKGEDFSKEDVAKAFQDKVIEVLVAKLSTAAKENNIKSLSVVGGVSANKAIREAIVKSDNFKDIDIIFPKFEYCTDNAAMIAAACYHKNLKEENMFIDAINTKRKKQGGF
ncbi:tRNA (adenosine(37)-N6)-threonylcarbamoyltransferase complex transferase subunit TsaD [Streptobacillus felis]|uniref:tRNA N6-adenosine threonylcarbamoyltransferase n=1 Tax=Streptobacillus felis TaxID=1384509 RepID=A0A7Z0PFG5_9FUSO|nr:tRNA (adenosine(37)-N6)-threonylcarbamoyltransferase complex transferase subunit TsaD [Streptobacillus felis]NYV27811.1 tRNA (adenosine(37)-N6)-threonylcarbamoyltransferase complex transferase subunit TsaD [Streptobacillus felis]